MKDLGPVQLMLGIEIRRDRSNRKLSISQNEYCKNVLKRFGMENCNTVTTPMDSLPSSSQSTLMILLRKTSRIVKQSDLLSTLFLEPDLILPSQ